MRNSSQNAGCMRLLPASHSCQPRNEQYMTVPASVWLKFKLSLSALICSGLGLAAKLAPPLFGWLEILQLHKFVTRKYADIYR